MWPSPERLGGSDDRNCCDFLREHFSLPVGELDVQSAHPSSPSPFLWPKTHSGAKKGGGFSANSRDKRRIHDSKVKYVFAENRGAFVGGEYGLPGAIPILVDSSCAARRSAWAGAASRPPLRTRAHPPGICRDGT